MKKNYTLFSIIFFCSFCVAQMQIEPSVLHPKKQFTFEKAKFSKLNNAASKVSTITNQGWFNYGEAAEFLFGATSDFNYNYLFPDSMGYGEFGVNSGNFAPCWIHHIAELVDFNSPAFSLNQNTNWVAANGSGTFIIDSMSVLYAYTRNHPNPNIIDTLIVTLYDNTNPSNVFLTAFTGITAANYSTDTLSFNLLGYNSSSNIITAPSTSNTPQSPLLGEYTFKILLSISDTAFTSFREKKFNLPIPFSSNGGKVVIADIMFKPGYNYSVGQHISSTANAFYFVSREENGNASGTGTYMNHIDCGFGSALCDNSMSYIVPKQVRYDTAGYWNNRYIPSIAYTAPFAFEHHLISFHLTDTIISPCQVNSQFSVFADSLNPGNYFAYNNSTGSGTLSYLWNFGDGTTSTQPYPFHQYAVPGQYVICLDVTATSGTTTCTDTYCDSSSVQKMAAGFVMSQFNVLSPTVTQVTTNEIIKDIMIYPNPVDEQLNIEFSSNNSQKLDYYLFDALGRTILVGMIENSKTTINTNNLAKGFYSLNIVNEKGNSLKTIKLVK